MNTSDVLTRAADLIEERGWTTGILGWGPDASSLCLEGALQAASGLSRTVRGELTAFYTSCPAYSAVVDYLGRHPQPQVAPIEDALWQWNDNPRRTAAEVIEVLRAAALIEAAREDQEAAWATYAELVSA